MSGSDETTASKRVRHDAGGDAQIEPLPRKERGLVRSSGRSNGGTISADDLVVGHYVMICHTSPLADSRDRSLWAQHMDETTDHIGLAIGASRDVVAMRVAVVHNGQSWHYMRTWLTRVWPCDVDPSTLQSLIDHQSVREPLTETVRQHARGLSTQAAELDALVLAALRGSAPLRALLLPPGVFSSLVYVTATNGGVALLVNLGVVLSVDYSYTILQPGTPRPSRVDGIHDSARRVLIAVAARWQRLVATLPPLTADELVAAATPPQPPQTAATRTPPTCYGCSEFLLEPLSFVECPHHVCADCANALGGFVCARFARTHKHTRSGASAERERHGRSGRVSAVQQPLEAGAGHRAARLAGCVVCGRGG